MTIRLLLTNALLTVIYMTLWYLVAFARKRLDTVDIAWGLGFVVVAWSTALQQPSSLSLLIAGLVSIWGLRLAIHIQQRAKARGDDPRYAALTAKWKGSVWRRAYVSIFLVQGGLVWLIGLPIMTVTGNSLTGLDWLSIVGVVVWLSGFTTEAISDHQLATYMRMQQASRPKVLQIGLWRYSRHPNYFGELLQWWGIAVIACQVAWGWLGFIGPLTLTVLILFISGIPPIERRRSKEPAYRDYQRRTSALVPLPPRPG